MSDSPPAADAAPAAPAAPMPTTPTTPTTRPPKLAEMRAEMARKRAEEKVEADRVMRRDLLSAALQCLFWSAAGLVLLIWSVRATDETLGTAAFWAGLGVGNAGIIFTLLAAYRRGEQRGDW